MKNPHANHKVQQFLKRVIDLVLSIVGLLVLWPIFGVIAIAIKLDSPGKIFFKCRRVGRDGRPFEIYKFRSMISGGDDSRYMEYLRKLIESDKTGKSDTLPYRKMVGDPRITRVGKYLRRYYLDELPQLFNVLQGDMSLVGPRPHIQFEVNNYTPTQLRRLSVKPGLTGLWQVEGKKNCSFSELIQLDLEYIDNWSLWLDLRLITRTMLLVFPSGGALWERMKKLKKRRQSKAAVESKPVERVSDQLG